MTVWMMKVLLIVNDSSNYCEMTEKSRSHLKDFDETLS